MTTISQLLAFTLDKLDGKVAIVDTEGRPSFWYQRYWQSVIEALVGAIKVLAESIDAITAAQDAADTANAAAAAATTAAAAAQDAADGAAGTSALTTSGVTGLTMTSNDAGADAEIVISTHTRVYGDGTSVLVDGDTIPGLSYSTPYWVYYIDAARVGGPVAYVATTTQANAVQTGDKHSVGVVTTAASGGGPSTGKANLPPGVVNP